MGAVLLSSRFDGFAQGVGSGRFGSGGIDGAFRLAEVFLLFGVLARDSALSGSIRPTRLEDSPSPSVESLHPCFVLWAGFVDCSDVSKLHKESAYGFGWVGGAGPDSFLAQFVAVTQSPNS